MYRSPPFDLEGYTAFTVKSADGTQKTVLEHREVMEVELGRPLASDEVVHHLDGSKKNNDPSNLRVMKSSEHAKYHSLDRFREMVELICVECGVVFQREVRVFKHSQKQGKYGPFCGKSCVGRWSRRKQLGLLG